ncbi:MAG: acyl carrier protein [Alphaproteobacteria bacterium]|nr:acyl carrier protein [Alphaproteobacteria bacterium]MBV8548250.1 acyl carrier protein [Alphaproteobacteria bacterium]
MSNSQIDEIMDIVAQKALLDRSRLKPEARLSDLNVSSLDMVEVVFALEDKFGITLPFNANTDGAGLATVGDVIALVEKQLSVQKAQG